MASVSIRNVYKSYGKVEVIHGLDLEIDHNEFVVLIGPSGCGKSTMLRMIAGLEDITGGEIHIGDRLVNNVEPKNRNIAMVFQNYALYPHMTVFKNISFGLRAAKLPKAEVEKKVAEAARILGLEDLLLRRPSELSGGQRQRVSMGRAIVRDPQIFLFDEPLSNLDATLRHQMRTEIKLLHQKVQTTIIYVTHDQIEAMTLADRIVIMRDGYIQQVGKPSELYHHPKNTFVAGFIGSPKMNMLPCEARSLDGALHLAVGDGLMIPLPSHRGASLREGQQVVLGIRPEDIMMVDGEPPGADKWVHDAHIKVVEPLGSESLLALDLGGHSFTGKCAGRIEPATGATAQFALNLENMHLFDRASEQAII
ncbi:MAG: ABC transporter ATP-binding protein [Alphaproteobacteria bacterium]